VLIERAALAGLLRRALPDPVITFGLSLAAHDLAGACAGADLVVGADGAHSSLRRELFGHGYEATATGTTVWRGTARTTTKGLTEYWGQRRRFGAGERPGGGTNWYATAVLPAAPGTAPSAVPQSAPEELRRLFGQWGGAVAATLASIDEESILRHEIYRLARRLPRYHFRNAVLVGDAAHAMTPDLGRGANEAVLDALSLVHNLGTHNGVDRALAGYDRSRRRTTQRVAAGSAAMDRLIHRGARAT
jgi:2-polyprenyl-6-methoxyphenol hydroxylase-like FAD-dependent oxidoreductase